MRRCATVLVLAGLALLAACSPGGPAGEARYIEGVRAARAAKDVMLAGSQESPIPPDKRTVFLPLRYFDIDPAFSVPASLEEAPAGQRPQLELQTSTKQRRRMERVGVLKFTLQGRRLQLGAFIEAGERPDRLFVPFGDETNGSETYSGGRYLDIPRSPTGLYTVDFNRAFNPYCYYNPSYDCPFPPKESRLPLRILAGERTGADR